MRATMIKVIAVLCVMIITCFAIGHCTTDNEERHNIRSAYNAYLEYEAALDANDSIACNNKRNVFVQTALELSVDDLKTLNERISKRKKYRKKNAIEASKKREIINTIISEN